MLGTVGIDRKTLVELRAVENTWDNQLSEDSTIQASLPKSRRYWIAPEDMLAAMRYAHSHALDVIGVYHSHPDHPAIPSECDRQLAWQQYSYVIVSVEQGTAKDCRSWALDDRHQFQPEDIWVIEPSNR